MGIVKNTVTKIKSLIPKKKSVTSTSISPSSTEKSDNKKTDIYINIDDISVKKPTSPDKPQEITVKENAPIYEKSGSSGGKSTFKQTATAPTNELLQQDKQNKISENLNKTEAGRKLNTNLKSLSEENTGKENVINQQLTDYQKRKFEYYQRLVNRGEMDTKEANYRLKSDMQVYQQQLIDAENQRRSGRYSETLKQNDVVYIGEFGDVLFEGDVKPIESNKTKFQKVQEVKETAKVFVVDQGKKGIDFLKKINWVDDLYRAIPNPPLSISTGFNDGKFNPFLAGQVGIEKGDGYIPVQVMKESALGNLEKWQQGAKEFTLGKQNLENIPDSAVLKNIETEYQLRFESKYYDKIVANEITFEEATADFQKSPDALQLQKNYAIAFANEELGLKQKATTGRKVVGYLSYGGLGTVKNLLGFTPTGARDVVVTGALGYGGYSLLTKIPASVIYGTTAVSFGVGTYQALNPLSSFEKASMGTTTAVLSAGILGYGAYKYVRTPVTTRTKIPFEQNVKTQAVGDVKTNYNIKYGNDLIKAQNVAFSKQKLGYQSLSGYRTVVTTRGRVLLNKYLNYDLTGLKVGNLYEGIPIDKLGYGKALKRLTSYGYTPSQARSVLRYTAPQLIKTELLKGAVNINLNKNTAVGRFRYETTKPVVSVDKSLGIKTRGGRTITDNYIVQRELTSETQVINKQVVNFDVVNERITRIRNPSLLGKSSTQFAQKSYVVSGDLKDAYLKFEIQGYDYGFSQTAKLPYKFQNLGQVYFQQQINPLKRKVTTGADRSIIREGNIVERDVNILKVTKTPVAKAIKIKQIKNMNSEELKQMRRDIQDIYKTPKPFKWTTTSTAPTTQTPSFIFEKTGSTGGVTQSQYAGTGLYERTESVAGFEQLRSAFIPPPLTSNVKEAILLKDLVGVGTGFKSFATVGTGLNLREFSTTKSNLSLKNSIREDVNLVSFERLALDQPQGLKQIQGLKTGMKLTTSFNPQISPPNINILKTPTFRPPKTPFVLPALFEDKQKKAKLKKKLKKKGAFAVGLLPDFTARSIGLGSPEFSMKDIEKELLSIKTGGEIRTGGRIKWQ
jgi:hypothetical protein